MMKMEGGGRLLSFTNVLIVKQTLVEQTHLMEEGTAVLPPSRSLRAEGRAPHALLRAADWEGEDLLDDEDGSRRGDAVVHEYAKCVR